MDDIDIRHDPRGHRFEAMVDGHRCLLDYALSEGHMAIRHTEVPSVVGGRGIAGKLMRAALAWARAEGLRVLPQCSYAADFVERHREYDDIVDRS